MNRQMATLKRMWHLVWDFRADPLSILKKEGSPQKTKKCKYVSGVQGIGKKVITPEAGKGQMNSLILFQKSVKGFK